MPSPLSSFDADFPSESATLAQPDLGAAFIKMLIALVALGALLFVTVWLIKRIMQAKGLKTGFPPSIHVLEKKMLSPKTMLYLVEVEGKKVLLAESQLEVRRLAESVEKREDGA